MSGHFDEEIEQVSASEAITRATGIEFEPEAALTLDQAATICADYPVVWAAFRSLLDDTHSGEISVGKEAGAPH